MYYNWVVLSFVQLTRLIRKCLNVIDLNDFFTRWRSKFDIIIQHLHSYVFRKRRVEGMHRHWRNQKMIPMLQILREYHYQNCEYLNFKNGRISKWYVDVTLHQRGVGPLWLHVAIQVCFEVKWNYGHYTL